MANEAQIKTGTNAPLPTGANVIGQEIAATSATLGGALPFYNDAVAGAAVVVKPTAGQLYALKVINTTAAAAYLQVFSLPAAGVVLGTTPPAFVIPLLANETVTFTPSVPVAVGGTGLSVAGVTANAGAVGAALKVSALFA